MSDTLIPLITGAAFLVLGFLWVIRLAKFIRRDRALRRTGEPADGTVIRLMRREMRPTKTGRVPIVYAPVIAWTTADGRRMEEEFHVARNLDKTPPQGTQVTVQYAPEDPTHWTLPDSGTGLYWIGFAVSTLGALTGGVILAVLIIQGVSSG